MSAPTHTDRDKKPAAGALATVPQQKLAELGDRLRGALAAANESIGESVALAAVVRQMREVVLPLVPSIRPLIGTRLGFRTDRDRGGKPPYDDATVADVMIEAVARGFRWVGNEMNIIGGNFYGTKEGYTRLVREIPGLTDLVLTPTVPRMSDGGAVVRYAATWNLDGKPDRIERDIPVRLNEGMGADGALGKATRKILAAIHGKVTGSIQSLADTEAEDVEPAAARPSKSEQLADRLAGAPPAGALFDGGPDLTPQAR